MAKSTIVRLLYNHNPFYLISAGIVLYAVQTTLASSTAVDSLWTLAAILAGVVILMAATGLLIVRMGRVWDDARSILLVILLMFFSMAVNFDSLCMTNPVLSISILVSGCLFAVFVTEAVLFGLKIRFPVRFRAPYYLILTTIFLYPLLFSAQQAWFHSFDLRWLMLAFPVLASAIMLTLLPAIRAGSAYTKDNGTPWQWPLFPWSVFFVLWIALCVRCYLIAVAFEQVHGMDSAFGIYFLLPIFMSVLILVLEIGIREQSRILQVLAMASTPLLVLLALPWQSGDIYYEVLESVTERVGSPLWISSLAAVCFCYYARIRGLDPYGIWLSIATGLAATCTRGSLGFEVGHWGAWPILALSIFVFASGLKQRRSSTLLIAATYLAIATCWLAWDSGYEFRSLSTAIHVWLLSLLIIGGLQLDQTASRINAVASLAVIIFGVFTFAAGSAGLVNQQPITIEFALLITVALLNWSLCRDSLMLCACGSVLIICLAYAIRSSVVEMANFEHKRLVGLLLIAGCCFLIGLAISLLKGGMGRAISNRLITTFFEVKSRFVIREKPVSKPNPG